MYLIFIGSYRKYTDDFIINLIDTIENVTLNCAEAACMLHMPERTHKTILHAFDMVKTICLAKEIKRSKVPSQC